jgi:sec-independent protein translocase protein TatA
MPNIGTSEIVLLLLLALLLFGAKRLPEIGRSMGRGMREFKDSITGKEGDQSAPAELPPAPNISSSVTDDMDIEDAHAEHADIEDVRAQHAAAAARLKEAEEQLRALEADRT